MESGQESMKRLHDMARLQSLLVGTAKRGNVGLRRSNPLPVRIVTRIERVVEYAPAAQTAGIARKTTSPTALLHHILSKPIAYLLRPSWETSVVWCPIRTFDLPGLVVYTWTLDHEAVHHSRMDEGMFDSELLGMTQ